MLGLAILVVAGKDRGFAKVYLTAVATSLSTDQVFGSSAAGVSVVVAMRSRAHRGKMPL
jgi:hypothetical protein